jgi:hypothetical protein
MFAAFAVMIQPALFERPAINQMSFSAKLVQDGPTCVSTSWLPELSWANAVVS